MRDTVTLRSRSTGEVVEFIRRGKVDQTVSALLALKDATLEKMRAEFAEYKANKNKEKTEMITAKRRAEEHVKKLLRIVFDLKAGIRQRDQDDARSPWYAELKKERDDLRIQVYNLDKENKNMRTYASNRAGVADQQYATVVAERDDLIVVLSEKISLYVHAKKVIAAFEREINKVNKDFWQTSVVTNPELPELREYIEVKESYDAERKRKLKESYQPKYQDRASSGSTAEAGNRDSVFAGGQVQVEAQEVKAAATSWTRPERSTSFEPVFAQSYGRGNRVCADYGIKANIEASRKSFSSILSPAAKEVFGRKYARNFQVQAANAEKVNELLKPHGEELSPAGRDYFSRIPTSPDGLHATDYLRKADVLLAIRDGHLTVVKNRFYSPEVSSCPRTAAGAQLGGRYVVNATGEPQPVFYDAVGNRIRFDSNGDRVTKYYAD